MPYASVDLSQIKTYPLVRRENRVALVDLIFPDTPCPPFNNPELAEVSERVAAARAADRPVVMMFGGHIIKRGLAPLVNALLKKGVITHLASNGAATIHDFEIAFLGHTSEDVAKSLANGSFGMAEETGALMNAAIRRGAADRLGMGESLGRLIADDPRFTFRENSVLYTAHRLGIPYTVHVATGTDIIHQHPAVDFAALGWTTGQDFKIFAQAVCGLEGGVFLNFGSAVIGPEVFLKALSIARNLGNPVRVFTTANFDIIPMRDYRQAVDEHNPDYYYRPRKNVVNRPVMLGGRGYHITGDHLETLPNLYRQVMAQFIPRAPVHQHSAARMSDTGTDFSTSAGDFVQGAPAAAAILAETLAAAPEMAQAHVRENLIRAYTVIERSFRTGGTLFVAGKDASRAGRREAVGALDKAKMQRSIPGQHLQRLRALPGGSELAKGLQPGLRILDLEQNLAAPGAVVPDLGPAQVLYVLARPGDIFLGISASGNSENLQFAASVAHLCGLTSIIITGALGNRLAAPVDIVIDMTAHTPAHVQAWQIRLYDCLCEMLMAQLFAAEAQS